MKEVKSSIANAVFLFNEPAPANADRCLRRLAHLQGYATDRLLVTDSRSRCSRRVDRAAASNGECAVRVLPAKRLTGDASPRRLARALVAAFAMPREFQQEGCRCAGRS